MLKSSNPSENMRFLNPTAIASPLTMFFGSAVLPAPPGNSICRDAEPTEVGC